MSPIWTASCKKFAFDEARKTSANWWVARWYGEELAVHEIITQLQLPLLEIIGKSDNLKVIVEPSLGNFYHCS